MALLAVAVISVVPVLPVVLAVAQEDQARDPRLRLVVDLVAALPMVAASRLLAVQVVAVVRPRVAHPTRRRQPARRVTANIHSVERWDLL